MGYRTLGCVLKRDTDEGGSRVLQFAKRGAMKCRVYRGGRRCRAISGGNGSCRSPMGTWQDSNNVILSVYQPTC